MLRHSASMYVLGTCFALITANSAKAQATSVNSRGKTSAEVLRDYGIDSSEASLLEALRNPTAKIRVLAAHQLAANHDDNAVPPVERAFAEEPDPMARVGIATALASLHDQHGLGYLQEICSDKTTSVRAAVTALQMIRMLQGISTGCTDGMLKRLKDESSKDYRDVIIPTLADLYITATNEQAIQITSSFQQLIGDRDEQPSVRLAAGQALAQIGVPSSLPVLKEAVMVEKDQTMHAALKSDLDALQKKVDLSGK